MATDWAALYPSYKNPNNPNTFNPFGSNVRNDWSLWPVQAEPGSLPSRTTTPLATGSLPGVATPAAATAASSGTGLGGWADIIKSGVLLSGALLAPDGMDAAGPTREAQAAARQLGRTGAETSQAGADTLRPLLHYLAAINSGDPTAIMEATAPERRKVLDQYDTARQASQFSPPGGGTASAMVGLATKEASDLSMVGAKARADAAQLAGQIGTQLTQTGAGTEAAAANQLTNLLNPIIRQKEGDDKSTFETFANLAQMFWSIAKKIPVVAKKIPFPGGGKGNGAPSGGGAYYDEATGRMVFPGDPGYGGSASGSGGYYNANDPYGVPPTGLWPVSGDPNRE